MFEPLFAKKAEPAPEEPGIPLALIRKLAAQQKGAQALEELTSTPGPAAQEIVYQAKVAAADDPTLLAIATKTAGTEGGLDLYEALGGTFSKVAIGAPMFAAPQAQPPATAAAPPRGARAGGAPTGAMPRVSAGRAIASGTTAQGAAGPMQPKAPVGGALGSPQVPKPQLTPPSGGAPGAAGV